MPHTGLPAHNLGVPRLPALHPRTPDSHHAPRPPFHPRPANGAGVVARYFPAAGAAARQRALGVSASTNAHGGAGGGGGGAGGGGGDDAFGRLLPGLEALQQVVFGAADATAAAPGADAKEQITAGLERWVWARAWVLRVPPFGGRSRAGPFHCGAQIPVPRHTWPLLYPPPAASLPGSATLSASTSRPRAWRAPMRSSAPSPPCASTWASPEGRPVHQPPRLAAYQTARGRALVPADDSLKPRDHSAAAAPSAAPPCLLVAINLP
jgi:hypothetical protein